MPAIEKTLASLADIVWGPPLLVLLFGVAVAETRSYLWEGNLDRAGPAATDMRQP